MAMQCEKCGSSAMETVKIFRLSGCLVAAGVALVVTSLAALAVGLLLAAAGPKATGEAVSSHDARAKFAAIEALQKIPQLPDAIVEELESTDKVSENTIARLPLEQRQQVRNILLDYHGARGSTGVAGAVTAGVGTVLVLVRLAFGVTGGIVGLLLVRRRKVWRCAACGIAFDRT